MTIPRQGLPASSSAWRRSASSSPVQRTAGLGSWMGGAIGRAIQSVRPWGMIEVFLLGVLVAIVKLSSMATVVAGPALWAFVALTVLLTAVLSFNPNAFWEMTFRPPGESGEPDREAA